MFILETRNNESMFFSLFNETAPSAANQPAPRSSQAAARPQACHDQAFTQMQGWAIAIFILLFYTPYPSPV